METFSSLLAICDGNSPVPGEFPAQRPVTRSFDVFFDLRLNKRLSKQSQGWWFETPSRPLWRHRNVEWNMNIILWWYELQITLVVINEHPSCWCVGEGQIAPLMKNHVAKKLTICGLKFEWMWLSVCIYSLPLNQCSVWSKLTIQWY